MTRTLSLMLLSFAWGAASASDWPGWRGPRGDGTTDELNLPVQWSKSAGVRWTTALPGKGVSSPVVTGDRVIVSASSGPRHDQLHIICMDRRDGRELWRRDFWGTAPTLRHEQKSSMATPTPVTDGRSVWVFFGTGDLFCLDLQGGLIWCRSLAQEYEPFQNRFAPGSSPVLVGDLLILQCDHWGRSYLLAIEKQTGKNGWKSNRDEHVSWSSPFVSNRNGDAEIIVCATFAVKGYDPRSGSERWVVRGMTRECIPTAVSAGDLILAVSGMKGETLAIRRGGRGDVTETHIAWRSNRGAPFVPSGIVVDGLYYLVDDRGIATCMEAETGRTVWQERLGGSFTASPVAGDGKIYLTDEAGTTTVIAAGPVVKILSRNRLEEAVYSSPAIAQGDLLIRTDERLISISGRTNSVGTR